MYEQVTAAATTEESIKERLYFSRRLDKVVAVAAVAAGLALGLSSQGSETVEIGAGAVLSGAMLAAGGDEYLQKRKCTKLIANHRAQQRIVSPVDHRQSGLKQAVRDMGEGMNSFSGYVGSTMPPFLLMAATTEMVDALESRGPLLPSLSNSDTSSNIFGAAGLGFMGSYYLALRLAALEKREEDYLQQLRS
jgi:hypothetical protein